MHLKWVQGQDPIHSRKCVACRRELSLKSLLYPLASRLSLLQCCNPELNGGGGWGIFNALLGWTNSATYGTVISYNCYWIAIIVTFIAMRYNEGNGHWPFMKPKAVPEDVARTESEVSSQGEGVLAGKEGENPSTTVKSTDA